MKNLLKVLSVLFILAASLNFTTNTFAATVLVYDFSQYQIPEGQPAQLTVDSSTIELMRTNPTYITAFVDALAARYDSSKAIINKPIETSYLTGVVNGTNFGGIHIPNYATAAKVTTPVVQDNTTAKMYVDINITTQTLSLYVNNVATVITPIVTGNVKKGHDTPVGNYTIVGKQKNRTLIGKNNSYRSWVSRWIPIAKVGCKHNGIRIHDANWRSNFDGTIYKTNGSHGCINVPPAIINSIYDVVSAGTPVYIHE
jgi:lipoprotein-anchoring transpeptidase ErfK/SrfK